jgi:hypothetical protein
MIAMTTNSSIKVKPPPRVRRRANGARTGVSGNGLEPASFMCFGQFAEAYGLTAAWKGILRVRTARGFAATSSARQLSRQPVCNVRGRRGSVLERGRMAGQRGIAGGQQPGPGSAPHGAPEEKLARCGARVDFRP